MTDTQDADKTIGPANEPKQRFRHSRRLGLVRSLMINIALIAMPVIIYFVIVMEHSSTYADQRSLRALQEIATQVDNRFDVLKNILKSAPREFKRNSEEWKKQAERDWQEKVTLGGKRPGLKAEKYLEAEKSFKDAYMTQKVNGIPGVPVQQFQFVTTCRDASGKCSDSEIRPENVDCPLAGGNAADIRLIAGTDRTRQLRMFDCGSTMKDDSGKVTKFPVVDTSFAQMIENTEALAEIPLIIVASERGDVLLQLARNHARDANPPAHEEVRDEPTVANLRELLVAAEKHAVNDLFGKDERGGLAVPKTVDGSAAEANKVGLPVALDAHIAGAPYRAYVLPYPLKVPICWKEAPSAGDKVDAIPCKVGDAVIYLIGLRRNGPVVKAAASLSPVLLLGVLLALVAACVLWPFLRHALLEPNDAVTWRQVHILCIAFLILTALEVLAARALEMNSFMYQKMDKALGEVAEEIETQLNRRISTELGMLRRLDSDTNGGPSTPCESEAADPKPMGEGVVPDVNSSIERFFRTDASGVIRKDSRSYSALTKTWTCAYKDSDVSKRSYFSLLKGGHSVGWGRGSVILQRLFNKSDGKKILQLAVPSKSANEEFTGILGVNVGTIEVTTPVLPLGIGYAIFERSTGTVVFHSDDSRSLVENLYAETEHNPTLSNAVEGEAKKSDPFDARYRSANTRFVYRHLTYSPWGLVAYYDSSAVSAVVAMSVVSALVSTVVTLLCGLALAHAVVRMVHRRHSWLWPQWRLRNAYPTASVYLAIVSYCEFHILRNSHSSLWQMVILLTAPLFALTACFSALSAKTPEITAQRPWFLRHGLGLVRWSRLFHVMLLITWMIAAWVAGEYRACLALGFACVVWATLMDWSLERPNANAWRRDLSPWPGSAMAATGRESYRMRYLLFVMSLVLVVSAVPALTIFDRTFEWYLSSALDLARANTNEQWEARVRRIRDDVLAIPQSKERTQSEDRGLKLQDASLRAAAAKLDGFGVAVDVYGPYINGKELLGVDAPTSCLSPPITFPLGPWEGAMHWEQGLLERLRQQAVASKAGNARTDGTGARARCGLLGTIDEVLQADDKSRVPPAIWGIVAGIVVLALSMLLLNFSARHVTGISLPWSGRMGRQSRPPASGPDPVSAKHAPLAPNHILLLQAKEECLGYVLGRAIGRIHEVDVATDRLDRFVPDSSNVTTWLLRRVEIAVLDESRRPALLRMLEQLVADPNARVIVIGDLSPVYRIARPHAYPGPVWNRIDDYERLRWIDLFSKFHKSYSVADLKAVYERAGGRARTKVSLDDPNSRNLDELIHRETRALWPCLRPIRDILLDRLHSGADMTDRDVIEFVALHGEIHYRKAWEYCTREERLALYQLAQGKLINMSNQRVIEHLLRRGLVVFEPEPRIKSISLMEFVLNAELPGRMEAWAAEAGEGLWQSVRVPFFVALMLVVAWIAYSSGDAFQAVAALIATVFAVISQIFRLLGMVGFSAPIKDK